jgi:putative tricarboxylic transport membrane protein
MKVPDIAAGAIGAAIGGYVLIQGARMPPDIIMKIGPAFFPSMLAIGLIAFSAYLAIKGALSKESGGYEKIDFRSFGIWRAVISLGISAVYAVLVKPLGFIPTSMLFIAALMLLLGYRKILGIVLVSIGATAGVYLVFSVLLVISLPVGIMSIFGL